jgi:hypothetical protein
MSSTHQAKAICAIVAATTLLWPLGARGASAEDFGKKAPDMKLLLGFLAGDYRLVGQKPNSSAVYSGSLTLRETGAAFAVTCVVADATNHRTASIETTGEGVPVLRMRFSQDGVEYAATYLWRTDLATTRD